MVCCLGSLAQSCCGEGGALQTNVTGLCGEHSQCSGHTGFAPAHGCVLPLSTLLRLQAALQGAGPELGAVPVFGYSTKARTRLGLRFVPSPTRAAQAARSLTSHSPQVRCAFSPPRSQPQSPCAPWVRLVSVLQSWSLATTLPADVNCPESQEVFG